MEQRTMCIWLLAAVVSMAGVGLVACGDSSGGDGGASNNGTNNGGTNNGGTNNGGTNNGGTNNGGTNNGGTNNGGTNNGGTNNGGTNNGGTNNGGTNNGTVCGDGVCAEGETFENCPADCEEPPECEDGQIECRSGDAFVCEDGVWVESSCPQGQMCVGRECVEIVCDANTARCVDDSTIGICNFNGTEEDTFDCPEGTFCEDAVCASTCEPGSLRCNGDEIVECQDDARTEVVVDICSAVEGLTCEDGECLSSCDAFDDKGGYIGCNYWGVDTPNRPAVRNRFAYVISNVNANIAADVIVEDRDGTVIVQQEVAPLEVATLLMPLPRTMNVADPNNLGASTLTDFGFRITTTVPINAYQFNPLQRFDNEMGFSVASNDASLLLPDSVLGTEYIGVAWRHWSFSLTGGYPSFLSIVSTADDNEVTVLPSDSVAAGDGIPALAAGQEHTFTLMRGQVLTLHSSGLNADLTGTVITADEGIGVFGGVECAQAPVGTRYCDHIEEMLFPVQAWDTEYYATKFAARGVERDIWRIVASEDQTTITTNPPQENVPVLNRGEFFEFFTDEDFKVSADKPILVVQYMTGSFTTVPNGQQSLNDGDPSMLLAVPARQYRRSYVFLVPNTYDRDWITITYPDGAMILLDDEALDLGEGSPIGDTGFNVVRVSATDGRHEVESDLPVGVSVYGYDFNISYAYPAGLDLSQFGE